MLVYGFVARTSPRSTTSANASTTHAGVRRSSGFAWMVVMASPSCAAASSAPLRAELLQQHLHRAFELRIAAGIHGRRGGLDDQIGHDFEVFEPFSVVADSPRIRIIEPSSLKGPLTWRGRKSEMHAPHVADAIASPRGGQLLVAASGSSLHRCHASVTFQKRSSCSAIRSTNLLCRYLRVALKRCDTDRCRI
jgi:hypothetical protein